MQASACETSVKIVLFFLFLNHLDCHDAVLGAWIFREGAIRVIPSEGNLAAVLFLADDISKELVLSDIHGVDVLARFSILARLSLSIGGLDSCSQ